MRCSHVVDTKPLLRASVLQRRAERSPTERDSAGTRIAGPAIIEHPGTTIVVLSGQDARIDEWRNTRITPAAEGGRTTHA